MKNNFLTKLWALSLLLFAYSANGQLYVSSTGNIGIGTSTPNCKLQIYASSNSFTFKPYNSGSLEIGGYDGSNNSTITFWHSNGGYNKLLAKEYLKSSDSTFKHDLHPLQNPIGTLQKINGYSYMYREDSTVDAKKEYGIIAQEVKTVLPEIVDSVRGVLAVDYDELIPFLIEAVKTQQKEIDYLHNCLDELKSNTGKNGGSLNPWGQSDRKGQNEFEKEIILYQNAPNPFNEKTTIRCYISQNVVKAQLCIYDMRGVQVKCILVSDRGMVDVSVLANTLPSGIYSYMLIGDGVISDAKQMILTK